MTTAIAELIRQDFAHLPSDILQEMIEEAETYYFTELERDATGFVGISDIRESDDENSDYESDDHHTLEITMSPNVIIINPDGVTVVDLSTIPKSKRDETERDIEPCFVQDYDYSIYQDPEYEEFGCCGSDLDAEIEHRYFIDSAPCFPTDLMFC
jgi:hypothetical protein